MSSRLGLFALVATLVGTGAFALLSPGAPARLEPEELKTSAKEVDPTSLATALPPMPTLPPGHPSITVPRGAITVPRGAITVPRGAIGNASSSNGAPVPSNNEAATIVWKVPAGWETAANPSSMRIATYRIPHVPGDTEDGEMSVARAGGTTDANIQRWLGQFDDAGKDERSEKTVNGLQVAIVGVNGTWRGSGMTPGSAPTPRPNWSLLGAIVATSGSPYFFKLIGPAATVRAARPHFDALIASLANK